jgi:hypothetical protein
MLQMVLIINNDTPLWYCYKVPPGIAKWLDTTYKTKTQDLTLNGHPWPALFAVNDRDFNGRKYCYI